MDITTFDGMIISFIIFLLSWDLAYKTKTAFYVVFFLLWGFFIDDQIKIELFKNYPLSGVMLLVCIAGSLGYWAGINKKDNKRMQK